MHLSPLFLSLFLLSTPTTAVLVVETSTSTYTAAAATSSLPSSPSSPSSTPSSQYTSPSTFESAILTTTNAYRAHHNASALTWNASLATYAASWASQCRFDHSNGTAGENLAEGYANVTDAVDAWGNEGRHYDYKKGGFRESTGHFTQLVWKGSVSVGCGREDCAGRGGVGGWLVVCEYWPRGNVEGEFEGEVGRAVGGFEVEGGGEGDAGRVLSHVAAEVNGGVREGGWRWGVSVVVGAGVLVGLGL